MKFERGTASFAFAFLRQPPENVITTLAGCGNLLALEQFHHSLACQLLAALQRANENLSASRENRGIQFKLAGASGASRDYPGCEQFEHPMNISSVDEMQRPSHWPGADDFSRRDGFFNIRFGYILQPQTDCPKRS